MKPVPAKYFAFPPYKAAIYSPKYAGVENKNGFNCLTFEDKPGATLTSHEYAREIADEWNKKEGLA